MENEKRMRREIANSNERRRMQSINAGFQSLRSLLPHHEGEKLSKVGAMTWPHIYFYYFPISEFLSFRVTTDDWDWETGWRLCIWMHTSWATTRSFCGQFNWELFLVIIIANLIHFPVDMSVTCPHIGMQRTLNCKNIYLELRLPLCNGKQPGSERAENRVISCGAARASRRMHHVNV